MRPFRRLPRTDECREDVRSTDGTITHNYLQQHEEGFDPPHADTPIEEGDTNGTDPWGITG